MRVPTLDPCTECGSKQVERESDGLANEYRCADCGSLIADLALGAEP